MDLLGEGLEANTSLREFTAQKCFQGSVARFMQGLKKNGGLQVLDISKNPLDDEGLEALGEALQNNPSI